ncbi:MAG: molybdopterin biosynthesis protein [Candidatus Woesearchaeota archaeon]
MREFHNLMQIDEAKKIFFKSAGLEPIGTERVSLSDALGRVLAEDVIARIDVPPFDRSSRDGYAVNAKDTFFADEESPVKIKLSGEKIAAGTNPKKAILKGYCSEISTGAVIPTGANAIVMVENTSIEGEYVNVYRPVVPGENVMHAGSDMMKGEVLVQKGRKIGPRESAVFAAQGFCTVKVFRKPKVAVISTGNEISPHGKKLPIGKIYDINASLICDMCREHLAEPRFLGIARDNMLEIQSLILKGLEHDMVILSGGTSAGKGDLCYRALENVGEVIVHGVAMKPGKPVVLGMAKNKPVIVLPGFPSSAAIAFMLFCSPLITAKAGLSSYDHKHIKARIAQRIYSERKHEFILVNLVKGKYGIFAYPISKSSGSITTFAFADGFFEIPTNTESILKDSLIDVKLFSENISPVDITFIGSHCVMLEPALSMLGKSGFTYKVMHAGSTAGIEATARGEADVAGVHLLDEKTGIYNVPFIARHRNLSIIRGYVREQGIVFRKGVKGKKLEDFIFKYRMINRNKGSGTRVLLEIILKNLCKRKELDFDRLIQKIKGYEVEANTHTAVAAKISQGKADWGIAIKAVAVNYDLFFIPLRGENYDFCVNTESLQKPSVRKFIEILKSDSFKKTLQRSVGIVVPCDIGEVVWRK